MAEEKILRSPGFDALKPVEPPMAMRYMVQPKDSIIPPLNDLPKTTKGFGFVLATPASTNATAVSLEDIAAERPGSIMTPLALAVKPRRLIHAML